MEDDKSLYNLEVVDWEMKGNAVRFYLGKNGKQYGDDWNDRPWDYNAGTIYDEFVHGIMDISFAYNAWVCESTSGNYYSGYEYCKDDFVARAAPCVVIVKENPVKDYWDTPTYKSLLGYADSVKIYFGDTVEDVLKKADFAVWHKVYVYNEKEGELD